MLKVRIDLSLDQKISSYLALIFVMILGFLVSWITLDKAQEIIKNSKESAVFNIQKRAEAEVMDVSK